MAAVLSPLPDKTGLFCGLAFDVLVWAALALHPASLFLPQAKNRMLS